MFWIKKQRAFYEEARTTKITRDTVLSFAYDYIFAIFLGDSGIGKTFESFKNVHKHRRCGRFSFKESMQNI